MSVLIPISSLSASVIKRLNTDLIVKPTSGDLSSSLQTNSSSSNIKTKMYKGMNIAPKRIIIECFDTFIFQGQDHAIIPFSYYYQHLHPLPFTSLYSHPKIEMEFEGDLLPRQKMSEQKH